MATPRGGVLRFAMHPASVVGLAITAFGVVALPAQYTPVLFDHDVEFVMLACAALAAGLALAAYRRARQLPGGHGHRTLAAAAVTVGVLLAATLYLRAIGGIGWPRPVVLLAIVVWVTSMTAAGSGLGAARSLPAVVRVPALAGLCLLAAVALVFGSAEFNVKRTRAAGDEHCEERRGIRYCFYDGYRPFVRKWAPPVEAVLAHTPPRARPAIVLVRQADDHVRKASDVTASPHLGWDDDDSSTAELALALDAANTVTGNRLGVPDRCGAPPARAVVVWWLAAQVDHRVRRQVADMARDDVFGDAVSGSDYAAPAVPDVTVAAALASQLLERNDNAVREYLWAEWETLIHPATVPDVIVDYFDLRPVRPGPPEFCD